MTSETLSTDMADKLMSTGASEGRRASPWLTALSDWFCEGKVVSVQSIDGVKTTCKLITAFLMQHSDHKRMVLWVDGVLCENKLKL